MRIVIIGASAAGMSFAAKYQRNCATDEIIIIEKNNYISFGACGLPYFVGNYFSDETKMFARTVEQMQDSGIDIRTNQIVKSVDSDLKMISIETNSENYQLSYDKLVVATGANPIVPFDVDANAKRIFTLSTFDDGVNLKNAIKELAVKKVAIIGAGFIGLEVMDAFHHLNVDVTMIQATDTILTNTFDPDMVQEVEQNIKDNGVKLHLNTVVETILENEDNVEITTDQFQDQFDLVVVAVGFRPNTNLFTNLEKLANGAIIIDGLGKTNVDDIYAVGDCATIKHKVLQTDVYIPLATNANKMGRYLADSMAAVTTDSFKQVLGSSAIKVLDYDLARTGISEHEISQLDEEIKVKVITDFTHTDYYPGRESLKIKIMYEAKSKKIVGAQIIGKKDVVHRLNTLALAIECGVTTSQLGYIDFAYAPPFSRTWEALNVAGNVCK